MAVHVSAPRASAAGSHPPPPLTAHASNDEPLVLAARFLSVADASRDGIWTIDREGITTFANRQMADLLGCDLEDLDGASVFDFMDGEALAEGLAVMERLRAGLPQQLQFRLVRPDGTDLFVEVATGPLFDDGGRVCGALGVLRDVGERMQVIEDLRHSEERFRKVFDQSPLGGLIVDADLRVVRTNRTLERMLGLGAEELVGRDALDFTHPDDQDRCSQEVARLFAGEVDEVQVDKRYVHADGRDVHVRLTASLVRDDDGSPSFCIGLAEDVTEAVAATDTIRRQREWLAMALDAGGLAAWELDLASGEYTLSDNLRAVFGYRDLAANPTMRDLLEIVVPEDRRLFRTLEYAVGEPFALEFRIVRDGEVAWVRSQGRVIGDADGHPAALRGTSVDVTEAREADQRRAEAIAVHLQTIEVSPDAFVGIDGAGRVTEWNAMAESLFGWSRDEALGRPAVDLIFLPQDRAFYQERLDAMVDPGSPEVPPARVELVAQARDGRTFPVELSLVMVQVGGAGQLRGFIRDITERRAHERDLADRALVDHVTGLANRTLLLDRAERAIARIGERSCLVAALFMDIDRFRPVNETLGHTAGDALLAAVAARLRSTVGVACTVARHGGDEFVVLCEDLADLAEAEAIGESVLAAFAEPFAIGGRRLMVSLSVGLAHVDSPTNEATALIRAADVAMHQAKSLGGSRLEEFDAALAHRATRRLDLEQELRRALTTGQVSVAYQPVVTFEGRIVSVEALARWDHPELGSIPPAEFVPVAEETGLIVELGERVLDEACLRLADWRARPGWERLTLAANLSGRQLAEPGLVGMVERTLARHGLPIDAICLEITESMLMDEASGAADTVDALAEMGIVLAVDDFGTGYSSLLYLRRFPVHALKLDRSFVAGIGTSEVDTAIVASMIDLARSLRLVSIAEGVETAAQADALAARGCDLAQGFFWSKAVPAEGIARLLAASSVPVVSEA